MPRRECWALACEVADEVAATGAGPTFEIATRRVAVLRADLAAVPRTSRSRVSAAVAAQYAPWWPTGERYTLQLEGLSIAVVAERVRAALVESFDETARAAQQAAEVAAHEAARSAIGSVGGDRSPRWPERTPVTRAQADAHWRIHQELKAEDANGHDDRDDSDES